MKAELVIRERVAFGDGELTEMVVWRVPRTVPPSTHSFKYRLVYIVGGRRVLGYDNERGKGDHKHAGGVEEPFTFTTIDELLGKFVAEVETIRSER
jgi:hypothetical protein